MLPSQFLLPGVLSPQQACHVITACHVIITTPLRSALPATKLLLWWWGLKATEDLTFFEYRTRPAETDSVQHSLKHGDKPPKRMKLTKHEEASPSTSGKEKSGNPPVNFGRRGLLGLTASALGFAAAETIGLTQALATTAAAPPEASSQVKPTPPSSGAAAEPKKSLLPAMEKPESRVYDASVLGEPVALSNKGKAWQKMLSARVVYLGEAERVHDPTDKELSLEIIQKLRDECFAQGRPVTVAFSAFPRPIQPDLDAYFGKKLSEDGLKAKVSHWAPGRWQETLPILRYCKENGVRLFAAGVPPEVLRTVQSRGIRALSMEERKKYAPLARGTPGKATAMTSPTASAPPPLVSTVSGTRDSLLSSVLPPFLDLPAQAEGLLFPHPPKTQSAFGGPGPYLFAQGRVVEEYTMAQAVAQAMADGAAVGLLIVITGASHVLCGVRGKGVPSRVDTKQKKQVVVLLNPERQSSRAEGALPEADYLWYAGSRACARNCFDRAEVARVMGAAGRRREALPQDLQLGLERGLISPETLQSFFELESQPWIAEATKRFQGLRERFYADPKFLHRLCIEEAISISTSLAAQYNRRGEKFWSEIEYVATDIIRGSVVDFFTVWLPAPTLSFDSRAMDAANALNSSMGNSGSGNVFQSLTQWVSSLPDNAFQRPRLGQDWSLVDRVGAVAMGGAKLAGVGFISSVGTVGLNNGLQAVRRRLAGTAESYQKEELRRSPVLKTALVYGGFLGSSANLRYQAIAGLVEHWGADYFLAANPLAGAALSFLARTANSYWGTGQWVDLARQFNLQAHVEEGAPGAGTPSGVPSSGVTPGFTQSESGLLLPEVKVEIALPRQTPTDRFQTDGGVVEDRVQDTGGMRSSAELAELCGQLEDVLKLEVYDLPPYEENMERVGESNVQGVHEVNSRAPAVQAEHSADPATANGELPAGSMDHGVEEGLVVYSEALQGVQMEGQLDYDFLREEAGEGNAHQAFIAELHSVTMQQSMQSEQEEGTWCGEEGGLHPLHASSFEEGFCTSEANDGFGGSYSETDEEVEEVSSSGVFEIPKEQQHSAKRSAAVLDVGTGLMELSAKKQHLLEDSSVESFGGANVVGMESNYDPVHASLHLPASGMKQGEL